MFSVDTKNISNITDIRPIIGMSDPVWILLIVYNIVIVVCGTVFNVMVLYFSLVLNAIKFDKVTLLLVHNLAAADLVLILVVFIPMLATIIAKRWVMGEFVCWFVGHFFNAPMIYEVWLVFLMSLYRFWLLRRSKGSERRVLKTMKWIIVGIFFLSCSFQIIISIVDIPPFFKPDLLICMGSHLKSHDTVGTITSVLGLLFTVVPVILMVLLNIGIAIQIQVSVKKVKRAAPTRTLIALAAVSWVFALTFTFIIGHLVLEKLTGQAAWYEITMMYLLGLNVLCNPIIYFITNKRFRKTVVESTGLSEIIRRVSIF